MIRFLGLGDNTIDTYLFQDTGYPGGNAVNAAVYASRLGAEAAYLGCVGADERGRILQDAMQAEGLDLSRTRVLPDAATAYALVRLVDGDRVFAGSDHGACKQLRLEAEDFAYIASFDLVHSSAYSYLEAQLPTLRQHAQKISFDFSNRHKPEYIAQVAPFIDFAFFSAANLPVEEQNARMDEILHFGAELVVATRGKEGAWARTAEQSWHQPSLPTEVVDTLGAGDAFITAMLLDYVQTKDLRKAMAAGAAYAARVCESYGAWGHGVPISGMGEMPLLDSLK